MKLEITVSPATGINPELVFRDIIPPIVECRKCRWTGVIWEKKGQRGCPVCGYPIARVKGEKK